MGNHANLALDVIRGVREIHGGLPQGRGGHMVIDLDVPEVDTSYDVIAEQAIVGAALISQDAADRVIAEGFIASFFADPKHELIWEAIALLRSEELPCDPIHVAKQLLDSKDMRRAGGNAYLHKLMSGVVTASNVLYHMRIVWDLAVKRQAEAIGGQIVQYSRETITKPGELVTFLDEQVSTLATLVHRDRERSDIGTIVDATLDAIRHGVPAVPTGLPGLDDIIEGWVPGTVTVIAARPSVGKTAVALQSALHVATQSKQPVGITTLEMPGQELMQRALAHLARVDYRRLRREHIQHALTDSEWAAIERSADKLRTSPLHIHDSGAATVASVRHAIRTAELRSGVRPVVWFVDYLQIMEPTNSRLAREQQVAQMSRQFKIMAKELKISICLISQLNRSPARDNREPQLSDLRDSGSIEQDTDRAILLHRNLGADSMQAAVESTEMKFIIAKNRQGQCGSLATFWDGGIQRVAQALGPPPPM